MTKSIVFFVLILILMGCSNKYAPHVSYDNISPGNIYNIQCNWSGNNLLKIANLEPGQSASESFYINRDSEYYGEVFIDWENEEGQKFSKTIEVTPEEYPVLNEGLSNVSGFNFYFTQDNITHFFRTKGVYTEELINNIRLMEKYQIEHVEKEKLKP